MKNLIKKILRETEDDGFDWVRDHVPTIMTQEELMKSHGLRFKTTFDDTIYTLEIKGGYRIYVCWRQSRFSKKMCNNIFPQIIEKYSEIMNFCKVLYIY